MRETMRQLIFTIAGSALLIVPSGLAAAPVTPQGRDTWRRRGIEHAAQFHWENAAAAVVETYLEAAVHSSPCVPRHAHC